MALDPGREPLKFHTVTVVVLSGAPTQQQTSLTSAGMVCTFSFSFVLMCLRIIFPVRQGDAQMSVLYMRWVCFTPLSGLCFTWVAVSCSESTILCVVMHLIVQWLFALNHAAGPPLSILGWEHQSMLPVNLHIRVIAFPVCISAVLDCVYCPTVDYIIGWGIPGCCNDDGEKCCATNVLNRFTIICFHYLGSYHWSRSKMAYWTNIVESVQIFELLNKLPSKSFNYTTYTM